MADLITTATDIVIGWNNVYLQSIRVTGGSPCPIARIGAMVHGAIYDAVNSIQTTHQPYLISIPAPSTASLEASATYGAYQILVTVYADNPNFNSTLKPLFDENLAIALALIADNGMSSAADIEDGRKIGLAAASAMIAKRANDGSENQSPYTPGSQPGDWRPNPPSIAVSPNWTKVVPFTAKSGSQFRPSRTGGYPTKLALLKSAEYAAQFNEVKRLGSATSVDRTTEETEIAFFWANDLDGTYKPPGQLYRLTQIVSAQRKLSLVQNARLFALVALAMGDAAIVAWDAKYSTDLDLWRPDTAIRLANTDGNPNTVQDPVWEPLSVNPTTDVHFTPPFPAYISGHATFGAAQGGIMRHYFGTDNITFTLDTEDPSVPTVKRTFNSFTLAALENARSRIYLGVHYQWDADNGFLSGSRLADYIFANFLKPVV